MAALRHDFYVIALGKLLNMFVWQVDAVLLSQQVRKRFINQVIAGSGFPYLISPHIFIGTITG